MNARYIYLIVALSTAVFSMSVCAQKRVIKKPDIPLNTASRNVSKVTYIANEGVLIETFGKKVLIDGLLRFYKTPFAFPPVDLRNLLENAKAPYANIDLILVSHLHGDHFHPKSVGFHLENSLTAQLATSNQIIERINGDFANAKNIASKMITIKHEWKKSVGKDFDGIKVKFLGLRHGSERFRWIQNLGHLVEINGKKFLHIGDADMTAENFESFKLDQENIDIAFIPYWFLQSAKGRRLVEKQFKPKNIIAVHVSPSNAESVSKELKSHYPEITVFTKILDEKTFR